MALTLAGCDAPSAGGADGGFGKSGGDSGPQSVGPICTGGADKALVMTRMRFARQEPKGVSIGFDLDGYAAVADDPKTCGHASLRSPAPASLPGVDNTFSILLPSVDAIAPDTIDSDLQNALGTGQLLLGFQLTGLDSLLDDSCVTVTFSHLTGHPTVGTDNILVANQTFDVDKSFAVSVTQGRVSGGYLDLGPFSMVLPVKIQDWNFPLTVEAVRIRVAIGDDGKIDGVIGGTVDVEDAIAKVTMYGIGDQLKQLLPILLRSIADLDLDPQTQVCRRFSMAASIAMKPAFINR